MANDLTITRAGVQLAEALGVTPAAAAALPVKVATALRWKLRPVFDAAGEISDAVADDFHFASVVTVDNLDVALSWARQSVRPSTPAAALKATNDLRSVARQRAGAEFDDAAADLVYARKLAAYPVDAIGAACEKLFTLSPFWPALSELLKACEREMAPRRRLLRAIEDAVARASTPSPAAPTAETAEERREAVRSTWSRAGRPDMAATVDERLAGAAPRRPTAPAAPRTMTAMDLELARLAEERRARILRSYQP